jgi:hypothetical protein
LGGIIVRVEVTIAQAHRFCFGTIVADFGVAVNDGPEIGLGIEPASTSSAVSGPADASGTMAQSVRAPAVSALTAASGISSGRVTPGIVEPT